MHGQVGLERGDVLRPDRDQVAGLAEPGVVAEHLGRVLEDGERVPGESGKGADPVVAPDDPARLAGSPRAEQAPLENGDLPHPELDECPRRAQPGHAAADDHDVGGVPPCHNGSAPGIQPVPASGTCAMAAASTVRAARSSGSRWWTSDLPQARASAVTSMVVARR